MTIRPINGWPTPFRREPTETPPHIRSLFTAEQVQGMIQAERQWIRAEVALALKTAQLRANEFMPKDPRDPWGSVRNTFSQGYAGGSCNASHEIAKVLEQHADFDKAQFLRDAGAD